jgi:diguanylate cyclase (GGDEF)-like protein/PAS domain S-box-containing protein
MWVFEADTLRFLEVNEAAIGHYGYSRKEFLAKRIIDVRPPEDVPRLLDDLAERGSGLSVSGGWRHRLKDGRIIDVEVRSHNLTFEGRDAVLVAVQDVTAQHALEDELRHQAFHDSLTNLANRALFGDRVEHAVRRQARSGRVAALLVLDLDGFKTVNDSLGHVIGDELLVAVATRLQSTLRDADTAARLGGDEFGILLEDLETTAEANEVAQRLIDALDPPFVLAGREVFIHASVGVTLAGPGDEPLELLRNADTAMYQAKSQGKGCYRVFEPSMHDAAVSRLELDGDLRRAIEREEFVVHYQPIASLGDGRVVGLEALVRWRHPSKGLIPPLEFIPFAEETGLIVHIGRRVLHDACRQLRRWQVAYNQPSLTVAVNVSARQLTDPNFVQDVNQALQVSRLDAGSLTLEITESVLIRDPEAAIGQLRALKAIGVRLAIDDFGTGYSSLSSLQHLPIDTLKIDKAFVDTVAASNEEGAGVVQAIIRLAQTLHLNTVAEGVEQPDQLARLEQLGCDEIQGFHLSQALPREQVEQLLAQRRGWHLQRNAHQHAELHADPAAR